MGDNITRPDHYCDGRKYEPKDVIRDWGLNFNLGSCVKYISRAGRKGEKLEDLKKAKQFLEFEIDAEENESKNETKNVVDLECFVRMVLDGSLDIENDFRYEKTREKIIDRIVEMIDNDKLDCCDISTDLYCGYQDIRDAIARLALRKERNRNPISDIGMTCKEAAEIGDAMAKGFEEGIQQKDNDLSLTDIINMVMKHNEIPEPDVIKLHFKFEDDPNIDTNTVSIKFHTNRERRSNYETGEKRMG